MPYAYLRILTVQLELTSSCLSEHTGQKTNTAKLLNQRPAVYHARAEAVVHMLCLHTTSGRWLVVTVVMKTERQVRVASD